VFGSSNSFDELGGQRPTNSSKEFELPNTIIYLEHSSLGLPQLYLEDCVVDPWGIASKPVLASKPDAPHVSEPWAPQIPPLMGGKGGQVKGATCVGGLCRRVTSPDKELVSACLPGARGGLVRP